MTEKTLFDYWIVLYRRKKDIAVITAISVVTAIILSKMLTPVYEARAVFYVPATSSALPYLSTGTIDKMAKDIKVPAASEDIHGPYIGLLKSKKIAELVHQDFPQKNLAKLLLSDMAFELTDEFMLKIYSRDTDPVLAANIANAYMEYLNLLLQEASLKNMEYDISLTKTQIFETKQKLTETADTLTRFEEENNIGSIDEELKSLTLQKVSFQNQLDETVLLIEENREKIKSISEQLEKEKLLYSGKDFSLTTPLAEHFQKKLADLAAQINSLSVEMKETHPDIIMLKREYEEIEKRLEKELNQYVSSNIKPEETLYEQLREDLVYLLIEKNRTLSLQKGYYEVITRVKKRLEKLPGIKMRWGRLNEEVQRYKKIYEQLRLNLQEAEIQKVRQVQFAVVVDSAKPPETPSFPIMWLNIVVALMSGLIAGVFYAFFIDFINETGKIRTRKIIRGIISEE